MTRLICAITGDVTWIPAGWSRWRIGTLHFRRRMNRVQWREMGTSRWQALPAIERRRGPVARSRRVA